MMRNDEITFFFNEIICYFRKLHGSNGKTAFNNCAN